MPRLTRWLLLSGLVLPIPWGVFSASPQAPATESSGQAGIAASPGEVLTAADRDRVMAAIRRSEGVAPEAKMMLMGATVEALEKADLDEMVPVVTAVVFDYARGQGVRYRIDARNLRVMETEVLRGVPQPSPEEVENAIAVIRRSEELAEVLRGEVVFEGGFLADPPASMPAEEARRRRLVEIHLLSRDRRELLRVVTVDLSSERVLSVSQPELGGAGSPRPEPDDTEEGHHGSR